MGTEYNIGQNLVEYESNHRWWVIMVNSSSFTNNTFTYKSLKMDAVIAL